ncbi:hypothetical protein [Ornithinibacillus californiensis]|uniref:hypothetical protein n=1 Tax=Ornithinibacillus californiensis TaxID=161536 RepID=UPI00064DC062|nr:hypothetical protein [Ornithinibacillus californiensis]
MQKRRKWQLFFIGILIAFLVVRLFIETNQEQSKRAIFSWSSEEVINNRTQLLNDLNNYNFDRVFQSFSSDLTNEEVSLFVEDITNQNIDVYGLSGTPEWALDPTGKGMLEQLDQIVEVNHLLPEDQQIKGLVIDVEPYLLDDFNWEDQSVQQSYISGIKQLYQAAEREGLELLVVVPYFYDTKGYQEVVRTIIREASSEVVVMNYYRDHEIEHLTFEAQEARNANKPLTTIYEFKRPGDYDLTEKNTYYYEGLSAARENADRLKQHYKDQNIHIAYHDYHAFREVIENE